LHRAGAYVFTSNAHAARFATSIVARGPVGWRTYCTEIRRWSLRASSCSPRQLNTRPLDW